MNTRSFLFLTILIKYYCTIIKSEGPCPTLSLISYNPKKYPKLPETKGFLAGKYFDNSTIYVGTGNSDVCKHQPNTPGRISTSTIGKGAGSYIECSGEHFDDKTPAYLANHPNLRWVKADITILSSLTGAVAIKSGDFGFFIGRINLTASNGMIYQQVSKLHVDNGAQGLWYINEDGSTASTDNGYEVLVCTI
ncbi:hypothetical protein PVAND_016154 [Polypedilum vanderplanki]|uniref:Uncharacterized protein n=1 Tax=Polypedilum vanderplanki TaxID=319348 RepID=A0A9J6BEM2_POLVA|nr:hypothetical protein PVAND_016154 [Polypedilum vanderplanki]